jgi:[calcium/calmodulin-dependent protein kinase] kinase
LEDYGYTGFSCDIWSAGVVLFSMVYGSVPFKASNMNELHTIIRDAKFTLEPEVSKDVRDLLKRMLEKNPEKRIKVPDILNHPWLTDCEDDLDIYNEQEKATIIK